MNYRLANQSLRQGFQHVEHGNRCAAQGRAIGPRHFETSPQAPHTENGAMLQSLKPNKHALLVFARGPCWCLGRHCQWMERVASFLSCKHGTSLHVQLPQQLRLLAAKPYPAKAVLLQLLADIWRPDATLRLRRPRFRRSQPLPIARRTRRASARRWQVRGAHPLPSMSSLFQLEQGFWSLAATARCAIKECSPHSSPLATRGP